jgi:hypothetical protein
MITIFSGRTRQVGGSKSDVFVQVNVDFRQHLHIMKGARLSVFLAIALHTNQEGWCWPTRSLLSKETGYNEQTISKAITDLCSLTISGQRLMLRYQPVGGDGSFGPNNYLIFPSEEEVVQWEGGLQLELPPCTGFPYTVEPYTVEPYTAGPSTENIYTNHNHEELEPEGEEETAAEADPGAAAAFCSLHDVEMVLRQKNGDRWYSHQLLDGVWCKGAVGDTRSVDPRTDWRNYE